MNARCGVGRTYLIECAVRNAPLTAHPVPTLPEAWSPAEVAATVADYFVMLEHELRGQPYNKREHNRQLQDLLNDRSAGAIEFKHANISAVLIELGLPYIDGYKPRAKYQDALRDEVVARLEGSQGIIAATEAVVTAQAPSTPPVRSLADIIVDAPVRERRRTYERRQALPQAPRQVNYLEREARNRSLGRAGEEFVLEVEHRRLWEAGHRHLAERIEHVAETRGDGLGYDILSFEETGRERLIEVKTTSFGQMVPFFATQNEVRVSEAEAERFALYRVFKFREAPRLFVLPGSLRESCMLDAVQYRASVL